MEILCLMGKFTQITDTTLSGKRMWILLLLFGLILSQATISQSPQLRFKYLGQKEGLSNTFVNTIAQDSTGFIWIGTINGLNRYDSRAIRVYTANNHDSTAVPNLNITSLYTDKKGVLWIGTRNGLCSYHAAADNFINYRFDKRFVSSENFTIGCIVSDSKNTVYVSAESVIYKYNPTRNIFEPVLSAGDGTITALVADQFDKLWIAGTNGVGLTCYNPLTNKAFRYPASNEPLPNALPSSSIADIAFKKHELWIGTIGSGLISLDTANHLFTHHPLGWADTESVVDVYVDRHNNLWSIDYTGLKFYNEELNQFFGYYPVSHDNQSFRAGANHFFEDNQGNYWTSYYGGGVGFRIRPKGFDQITASNEDYWHISSQSVYAISDDQYGNLWIGHNAPGIDVFQYNKGKVKRYNHQPNQIGSIGSGTVNVIFKDRDNQMWIGTYKGGLQRYNPLTETFTSFTHDPTQPGTLSNNDIRSIDQDSEGNLWLVTHGSGVDKYDYQTQKFTNFNKTLHNLSNPWTNHLICDRHDNIWVATAWGLNKLSKDQTIFECYYSNVNDSTKISSSNVLSVFEDTDGNIWIGTDLGLNQYIPSTNSFRHISTGNLKGTICAIEEDNEKNLWISTLWGITRYNRVTGETFDFDRFDGIQPDEFNTRAVYKNYNGAIFFGGINGITVVHPSRVKLNTIPPPVVISSISMISQSNSIDGSSAENRLHIEKTNYLEISHKNRIVTFDFIAINFNNPQRITYAYKMDGLNKNWVHIGNKTEATFNNLNPGLYTFMVKATNEDGLWNEKGASIQIRILPPWYGTLTFKLVLILVLLLAFWGILKLRTHKLMQQKIRLARQVKDKTQELLASNQELLAQTDYLDSLNKLLEERQQKVEKQAHILASQSEALRNSNHKLKQLNLTKDKLFSIIAHDLLNPFNTIMGLSELFKETYHEMTEQERIDMVNTINLSSNRLFNLLQNLLLWARSQTNSVKFDQENFLLLEAIEESTDYLSEPIKQKNIRFTIQCPERLSVYADIDMIKTIIRNLVSNAIKFTRHDGNIKVVAELKGEMAKVSVIDDGIGMDEEAMNNLFVTQLIRTEIGTDGERGTGLGLLICKEFVERNKGELKVESQKGIGSTFSFTIPISRW